MHIAKSRSNNWIISIAGIFLVVPVASDGADVGGQERPAAVGVRRVPRPPLPADVALRDKHPEP